ncbi:MAG TPA: PAS domain-containing protein [Usitatibacteraceae bacterium]|nr:PAS domain-containing protein [Usitatibacteraceae bacterium]HRA22916.1 PAS domain-containing protein [Usitatibacteraceae bacterium]
MGARAVTTRRKPARAAAKALAPEVDAWLKAAALDVADDGIVISDATTPDAPIVYVSPSFERLVGYPAEEILGTNCRMVQGPGTDRETVKQIAIALQEGRVFQGEILNYRKDGTAFWNFLRIAPIRDASGRVTHHVGTQSDVTELHQAREREQELVDAVAHASRVRTVAALGASLAHEVNQPLAAIVANAEAALRYLESCNTGEIRDALTAIRDDARRAGEIILRAHRLVRKQPVAPEPVDAARVAREVLAFTRVRLRHAGVEARLDCPVALPRVLADPVQLYQALLNLVVNAIDAMEGNPPESPRTLAIAAEGEDGGVRIRVTDSGHGADDETLARMAQTFHTTKARGTGLGLLVTRSLVEAHGGRLDVARNAGRGLTFTIHLPGETPT